jgi:hypothetical protein
MEKKDYEVIRKIMANHEFANKMEKLDPGIKDQMAGILLSPWLPSGLIRKMIMLIIVAIAIIGALFYKNNLFYLLLLILPIFSPRSMGEILFIYGKIFKQQRQ